MRAKQDAELIVLDPADFGVSVEEPTSALDERQVVPTMMTGPGKIAQLHEDEDTDDGIMDESINRYSRNKKLMNESWSKVAANSSKPNKNIKPDDFTLLMG